MTQTLKLNDALFKSLDDGDKGVTIRIGIRDIELAPLVFEGVTDTTLNRTVNVIRVSYCRFLDISIDECHADGAKSLDDLYTNMLHYYPDLKHEDYMTVVRFKVMKRK